MKNATTPISVKPVVVRTVKVRSVRGLTDNGEDMPAPRGGCVPAAPLGGQQQHLAPPYDPQDPEEEEDILVPEADPTAAAVVMPTGSMYNMSSEPNQQQQVQQQGQYNVQYEPEPENKPYIEGGGGAAAAEASASVGSYSYNPGQDPAPPADHTSYTKQDTASKQSATSFSSSGGIGNKKTIWIAVVALVLILIGGGVGIVVTLSGGSDSDPAPSPVGTDGQTNAPTSIIMSIAETVAPTLPPPTTVSPTSAPSEQQCHEELGEYRTCLQALSSFDSSFCNECIMDFLNTARDAGSCIGFTDQYCESIDSCNCQGCEDNAHVYFNCLLGNTGCLGDCPEELVETTPPTKAPIKPTRTAAPTFGNPCQSLVDSYQSCLVTLTDAQSDECIDCTNRVLQGTSNLSCEVYNNDFCTGYAECTSCGWCRDEITAWVDCQIDGDQCELDCFTATTPDRPVASPVNNPSPTPTFQTEVEVTPRPTPRPTPLPTLAATEPPATKCQPEVERYSRCLAVNVASQNDRLACISCVNDASINAPLDSCESFAGAFCSSLDQCTTCGSCAQVATSYIDCLVSDNLCALDCKDPGLLECSAEDNAYQGCLPSLGNTRALACVDCYNEAVLAAETTTCDIFQSQFCSAFSLCDCGSCADGFVDWLDCRYEKCSISC